MRKTNMCIVVWRDMLAQIKNYKWFKANTENGSAPIFWMIYFFCIIPLIWGAFENRKAGVLYFSFAIALVLSLLLGRICPMRLPKIMYLCPMEAEERRKYLVTSYVTKVLVSVLLSCIAEAIPYALGYVTWYSALMAAFSVAMLTISTNMAGGDRVFQASDAKDRALKKRCSGYNGWMIGQQIYAIFYFIIMFLGQEMTSEENMPSIMLVLFMILTAINLFLTLRLLTFFKGTLEVLMNYESVYEIEEVKKVTA